MEVRGIWYGEQERKETRRQKELKDGPWKGNVSGSYLVLAFVIDTPYNKERWRRILGTPLGTSFPESEWRTRQRMPYGSWLYDFEPLGRVSHEMAVRLGESLLWWEQLRAFVPNPVEDPVWEWCVHVQSLRFDPRQADAARIREERSKMSGWTGVKPPKRPLQSVPPLCDARGGFLSFAIRPRQYDEKFLGDRGWEIRQASEPPTHDRMMGLLAAALDERCRATSRPLHVVDQPWYRQVSAWLCDSRADSLLICGGTGTGKTMLVSAAVLPLIKEYHGVASVSIQMRDFVSERGETVTHGGRFTPRLVFVDDLGSEPSHISSSFGNLYDRVERLMQMMDEGQCTVIMTSNLTPAQIKQRYGDRAYSRMLGRMRLVTATGRDLREG